MGPLARVGAWGAVLSAVAVIALGWHAATQGSARPVHLRELAREHATTALSEGGFPWARLTITDSVGVLLGDAPDEPARAALEARARDLLAPYMGLPGVFLGLDNRVRVRARQRVDALADLPPTTLGAPSTAAPAARETLGASCAAAFQAALGGEEIRFRAASAQLDPAARLVLRRLGSVASRCPGWRLVIEGHADARGDPAVNDRLARRRAAVVAAELLLESVPVEQLETMGVVVATPPGRRAQDAERDASSRRVAFRFVQTEAD